MSLPLRARLLRRLRAFTLLELLVSVVVIGILASLALMRFGNAQEKAYTATMQSDLRNFATARAIHISESDQLPGSAAGVSGYSFSDLVFEAGYQEDSATEWALLVGHNKTDTRCVLSTFESNGGAHRISCARDLALDFTATSSGSTVTVDATEPINTLAFAPDEATGAAWAARPQDIAVVSWEYGDGVREGGRPEEYTVRTHTYAKPGNYTVKLTLVKKTGEVKSGTRVAEVTGIQNQAPIADFASNPTPPAPGASATFTATASDPDGDALSYSWNWGDGTANSTGASVSHTFATEGTFTVTLTVTDAKGLSTNVAKTYSVAFPPVWHLTKDVTLSEGGAVVVFNHATSSFVRLHDANLPAGVDVSACGLINEYWIQATWGAWTTWGHLWNGRRFALEFYAEDWFSGGISIRMMDCEVNGVWYYTAQIQLSGDTSVVGKRVRFRNVRFYN